MAMYLPYSTKVLPQWVSPFGYLRVYGYLLLTAAFRSLSRPSSAPDAKSFSLRSLQLDQLGLVLELHKNQRFAFLKLKFLPIYSRISKKPFHIYLITFQLSGFDIYLCHFLVSLYHRLLHCLVFKVQSFNIDSFAFALQMLVEMRRIELLTPCLQGRCSPS